MHPQKQYKQTLERGLQGSELHSVLFRSRVLFSRDEVIEEWHSNLERVGQRGRETQLMNAGNDIFALLTKAEKWFYVKRDFNYSFLYIMFVVQQGARVETIMHGEVPRRKAIYQARVHNPNFFDAIFTDLMDKEKDEETNSLCT